MDSKVFNFIAQTSYGKSLFFNRNKLLEFKGIKQWSIYDEMLSSLCLCVAYSYKRHLYVNDMTLEQAYEIIAPNVDWSYLPEIYRQERKSNKFDFFRDYLHFEIDVSMQIAPSELLSHIIQCFSKEFLQNVPCTFGLNQVFGSYHNFYVEQWLASFVPQNEEVILFAGRFAAAFALSLAKNNKIGVHTHYQSQQLLLNFASEAMGIDLQVIDNYQLEPNSATCFICLPQDEATLESLDIINKCSGNVFVGLIASSEQDDAQKGKNNSLFSEQILQSGRLSALIDMGISKTSKACILKLTKIGESSENVNCILMDNELFYKANISGGLAYQSAEAEELLTQARTALFEQDNGVQHKWIKSIKTQDLANNFLEYQSIYNLYGNYHELQKLSQIKSQLKDIAQVIRPLPYKFNEDGVGQEFFVVTNNDINDIGIVTESQQKAFYDNSRTTKGMQNLILQPNDILFTYRGMVSRAGVVLNTYGKTMIASQVFVVIRLNNDAPISPIALLRYLRSKPCQDYFINGTPEIGFKSIPVKRIEELPVPALSPKAIKREEELFKEQQNILDRINQLKNDLLKLEITDIPENWD